MFDLKQMRDAAAARLVRAKREADVLEQVAEFGRRMDLLSVPFEVLKLDTDRIEISLVMGCVGDPKVRAAVADDAPVAVVDAPVAVADAPVAVADAGLTGIEVPCAVQAGLSRIYAAGVAEPEPEVDDVTPETPKPAPVVDDVDPAVAKPKKASRKYVTGPWSDDETAAALDGIKAGRSNGEIAAKLGRHAWSCNMQLAKLRQEAAVKEPTAPVRKRKLVPGKNRAKKTPAENAPVAKPEAAKPEAAVQAKVEKPAATLPFAERAGVVSLPARAAPVASTPDGGLLRSGVAGDRPYAERAIIAHLNGLGYAGGWNAERDLELVEEICRGSNLAVVATELQVGFAAAQARWRNLNFHIGDTDHQGRLVRILRERADA